MAKHHLVEMKVICSCGFKTYSAEDWARHKAIEELEKKYRKRYDLDHEKKRKGKRK